MAEQLEEDVFTGKIDWALWRKVLVFARPYRKQLLRLTGLATLVATWDVLLPFITGRIIDTVKEGGNEDALLRFGLLYAVIIVTFASCVFGFIMTAGRIATAVSYDIREAAFAKLQQLTFSYYDRKAVGWLMARLTSDCNQLSRIMGWALLDLTWGVVVLTFVSSMMFYLNWKLALIVLLIVPSLVIVSRYFQVRLLLTSRALRKANSQTTAAFNEGIVGVRTTKSLVREGRNLEEFQVLTGQMYGHAVSNALYQAMFLPIVLSICGIGTGLALAFGGLEVINGAQGGIVGGMSIGVLVMFLQYAGFVMHPVQELANTITMVQGAQASAERIQGLLDEPVTIQDSPAVVARIDANGQHRPGVAIDGMEDTIHTIEFRDVSFEYLPGQPVLKHFNLKVRAGETVALVGPTGGGKSTIVSLACRFYEPTNGQVLINGTDYRERSLHWLQANLGMVLQQPHLFSGTIRENIRYGRLSATDDEIERAARMVNAHEFIARMPQGYDTNVGEGGNQLSTGQKQLISLARAVIADPQIFVMDEATSSVDTQTERLIQDAIDRVLENRISFVIAHRLSTIRSADKILVISGGQVIEQGSHHELIRRRGHYFELYTNQFTHEKEEQVLSAERELDEMGAGAPA